MHSFTCCMQGDVRTSFDYHNVGDRVWENEQEIEDACLQEDQTATSLVVRAATASAGARALIRTQHTYIHAHTTHMHSCAHRLHAHITHIHSYAHYTHTQRSRHLLQLQLLISRSNAVGAGSAITLGGPGANARCTRSTTVRALQELPCPPTGFRCRKPRGAGCNAVAGARHGRE